MTVNGFSGRSGPFSVDSVTLTTEGTYEVPKKSQRKSERKEKDMKIVKMMISIGALLLILGTASNMRAELRSGSYFVNPMVGGYLFEGDQKLNHRPVYGFGLGYNFDQHWGAEAVFNYIDTESRADAGDVNAYLYRLNGLYHFTPFGDFIPYLAAGIGGISFDPDRGDSDSNALFNYGAGLKYFLTESLALQGDVRHIISFSDTHHNLMYTVGVTYYFGGERKKEVIAVKEREVTPVKETVIAVVQDSDGDGVPDDRDQCPRTPKGATVNEVGCWICKGLEFDFDKWNIKPQYYPVLDEAVDCMNHHSNISVEIQGHTCDMGAAEYNQALSEKRANEVRNYFIEKGIAPARLTAVGYGLTRPIADNTTKEGRAKNRRVQLNPIY
jgi:OOP family OmpA-OmpF porin